MLLGLDNAGKTTLLKSLASEDVNTITPTQVRRIYTEEHTHVFTHTFSHGTQLNMTSRKVTNKA